MKKLDAATISRAARIICDIEGPAEKRGWELERLLRNAGWAEPPKYDGDIRVRWLEECLEERSPDEVGRALCRACDPLEYDDGGATAEAFRSALNAILEPERLAITVVAGRPVIGAIEGSLDGIPIFGPPENLAARLSALVQDEAIIELLVDRADQSRMAQSAGAYLLAIFGIGSFVEGLTLSVLTFREPDLEIRDSKGKVIPLDKAGMELLLEAAHSRGHIELDAKAFMTPVRNFRNYIHPRRQAAEGFVPDADTVSLSWGPVLALLTDLEQSAPQGALSAEARHPTVVRRQATKLWACFAGGGQAVVSS